MAEPRAYPLEQFVARLREAGLAADARTLLSLQQALHALSTAYADRPLDLWEIMAPIVAKNRDEQDKVKALWLQFCEEMQSASPADSEKPIVLSAPPKKKRRRWWIYIVLGVLVLLALGGYLILRSLVCQFTLYDTPDETSQISEVPVMEGDTAWADTSTHQAGRLVSMKFSAYVESGNMQLDTGRVGGMFYASPRTANGRISIQTTSEYMVESCNSDSSLQISRHTITYPVQCSAYPDGAAIQPDPNVSTREVRFSWTGKDSGDYHAIWLLGDGDSAAGCPIVHQYTSSGTYTVVLNLTSDLHPSCAPRSIDLSLDLNKEHPGKPTLPTLQKAEPHFDTWHNLSWVWGVFILIMLWPSAGFILLRMRSSRVKEEKQAQQKAHAPAPVETGGPYRIPWPNQDHLVSWGGDIDRIAALMAGRITGDRLLLDVKRSLRKTVEEGGFPSPVFRQLGRQQEWLFLLDEGSMNAQQRRLFTWLIGRLRSETVDVEAYWYHGSPTHCWHITDGSALTLEALSGVYARAHLVLVTDGAGLMQPFRQELRPQLVASLKAWHRRTLMPLRPVREWASRELELSSFFGICPAESAGWMEYLLQPQMEAQEYPLWKKRLGKLLQDPPRWPRDPDSMEEVVEEMGDGLHSRWLRALLALPETSYEFLLAAGSAAKGNLLTWDDLVSFTRLPLLTSKLPSADQMGLPENDSWYLLGNAQAEQLLHGAQAELLGRGLSGHAGTMVRRDLAVAQYRQQPGNAQRVDAVRKWQLAGLFSGLEPQQQQAPAKQRSTPLSWRERIVVLSLVALSALSIFLMNHHFQPRQLQVWSADSLRASSSNLRPWPAKVNAEERYMPGDSGWNMMVDLYDLAKQYYEEEQFDSARGCFWDLEVLRKKALDSISLLSDSVLFSEPMTLMADLSPDVERQRSITLLSLYGRGLCDYYDKKLTNNTNVENARERHDEIMRLCPDFYERYALYPPTLQTLLVNAPYVQIPAVPEPALTMEVLEGAPFAEVEPGRELDLGQFTLSPSNHYVRIRISNPGDTSLSISEFRLMGLKTVAVPARTVAKGKPTPMEFSISLAKEGSYDGSISFRTNIKNLPLVKIPVHYEVKKTPDPPAFLYCQFSNSEGKDFPMNNGGVFDLGKVDVNGQGTCSLMIGSETAGSPLDIASISLSGSGERFTTYTRSSKETRYVVDYPLTLNFTIGIGLSQQSVPPVGKYATKITFRTSDKRNDPFEVTIRFELAEGSTSDNELLDLFTKDMVKLSDGTFQMGCTEPKLCNEDNKAKHPVYVSGFSISKYEVTVEQWMAVMGTPPDPMQQYCKECAVGGVSWNAAQEFISKLNKMTEKRFRLPTEAEWEYAARGGSTTNIYAGGNDKSTVVQEVYYQSRSLFKVGMKKANGYGLFDMSGNALEWCDDFYKVDYYKNSPDSNPQGPSSSIGTARVLRSGGEFKAAGKEFTVFGRYSAFPSSKSPLYGLRLVLVE